MNKIAKPVMSTGKGTHQAAFDEWQQNYHALIGEDKPVRNRSGIKVEPLYWPSDDPDGAYNGKLGFPGADPMTRGIYPTMHRSAS